MRSRIAARFSILTVLVLGTLALPAVGRADDAGNAADGGKASLKESFRAFGHSVADLGKAIGSSAAQAGKDVGQAASKTGRDVAKEGTDAGAAAGDSLSSVMKRISGAFDRLSQAFKSSTGNSGG